MADHDQQYLIELDGNQTVPTLFRVNFFFFCQLKYCKAAFLFCFLRYYNDTKYYFFVIEYYR